MFQLKLTCLTFCGMIICSLRDENKFAERFSGLLKYTCIVLHVKHAFPEFRAWIETVIWVNLTILLCTSMAHYIVDWTAYSCIFL
jgi:hypothetical protein